MEYYPLAVVKRHGLKSTTGAWISQHLLWRPLSPYVTWMFANLRLTSIFAVSLSIIFCVAAVILLFFNGPKELIVAAICIEIYALLDHVDGELARFEMGRLGKDISRAGHFLDLFTHKISAIAIFAIGWAVAESTSNSLYTVVAFMLCFFIFGPANEPANQIIIAEAKKTDMGDALRKLKAFSVTKHDDTEGVRPARFLLFMNELIGFPGWLHLITIACLLDAFVAPLNLLDGSYLYREVLLIGLLPVYVAKFLVSSRWYLKIMLSIRHG